MVRVIPHQAQPDKGKQQAPPPELGIKLISLAIAKAPKKVAALLRKHEVPVSDKPSNEELVYYTIEAIDQRSAQFNRELAQVITPLVQDTKAYDHFDPSALMAQLGGGGSGKDPSVAGSAATIGTSTAQGAASGGTVGLVAGAVAGITNVWGNYQEKGMRKQEANNQALANVLAMRQNRNPQQGQQKGGSTALIVVAAIVGVAVVAGVLYFATRPKKGLPETAPGQIATAQ